jgi:hypothetical protein
LFGRVDIKKLWAASEFTAAASPEIRRGTWRQVKLEE